MKITTSYFAESKNNGNKITMLTAYDYTTAKLIDESGIDAILVGDSLGMVMLGYDSTLPVTMEDMIHHAKAVARGAKHAFVVADMPFMSYQASVYDAVTAAGRLIKETGVQAVKLEGGKNVCPQIKAITEAQIPVMGHLGLTPQSINSFGGYKIQGVGYESAKKLIEDAFAVQEAGAFSVVFECIPAPLAEFVTMLLDIPTIGIGAGSSCNGQVLVYQDMLSMYDGVKPRFVRQFADIGSAMCTAFDDYKNAVQKGEFPEEKHTYKLDNDILRKLMTEYSPKNR
ncbi:MAG TPA: 3-methyl-2-oxobutanoate hydroxymethyltransferase [Firmicutes bacterium]|nr:3-methyl-2-oxobutanoate hydroxymethyltransferase [Bacillota bacterium]